MNHKNNSTIANHFWENPDNEDENPGYRILVEISEKSYESDAVRRYADMLVHELASEIFGSFFSGLSREKIMKYGYEYTDENAYRQYLNKIYETIHGKDLLYMAFINSREGHYNAAIYGLDYDNSPRKDMCKRCIQRTGAYP